MPSASKGSAATLVKIEPSPRGDGAHRHHRRHEVTGKVREVIFVRFGDFAGFVVDEGLERRRTFRTREAGIARVMLEAGKDRWLVSVILDEDGDSVRKIVLRC